MGFFDPNTIPQRPNLEPPGFDLLRAMMMQRTADTFSNPYGLNEQFMQGGGFGPGGGGGGQMGLLQALLGMNRPQFDPYSAGMPGMQSPPSGPNSQPMGGGGGRRPRPKAMYDGQTMYDGPYDPYQLRPAAPTQPRQPEGAGGGSTNPNFIPGIARGMPNQTIRGGQPGFGSAQGLYGPGMFPGMFGGGGGSQPQPLPPENANRFMGPIRGAMQGAMGPRGGMGQAMAPPPGGLQMPGGGGPFGGRQTQPMPFPQMTPQPGMQRPTMPGRPGMPGMMPQYDGIPLAALMAAFGGY